VDIVMVKRDGRFSGEAFVVLGSLQLVDAAMTKHRQFIGQRFIEIFPSQKRVRTRLDRAHDFCRSCLGEATHSAAEGACATGASRGDKPSLLR
jgi:hypothetical protein